LKNPGFVLNLKKPQSVKLSIVSTDPIIEGHEIPSLSICIFEILDNFKFWLFQEDESYAGRAWGYHTDEILFPAGSFLVLCVNYDKGLTGNFLLSLHSDEPLPPSIPPFKSLFYYPNSKAIRGQWKESGGSQ